MNKLRSMQNGGGGGAMPERTVRTSSIIKSDNPALEPALKIIAARKRQKPTDQQVITGPGIGASLQSFFNETVPPEIRAQILEHKQQCASAAAAMPHDAAAQTRQATPIDPDVQPPPPPKQKT